MLDKVTDRLIVFHVKTPMEYSFKATKVEPTSE